MMITIKDGKIEVVDVSAVEVIEEWLMISDAIIKNLAKETNKSEDFIKDSMVDLLEEIETEMEIKC